jgi:NADPH2:quinone reductase
MSGQLKLEKKNMYAIMIQENNDLVWTQVPDPQPSGDQVIIDIHAAALNRADLLQRMGQYPPPPGWPDCMGLEVAGIISYAPPNSRWQVGDQVCALLGGGGYAEKVAVPQGMVLPIPEGLSFVQAAAIPEAFTTSFLNICIEGQLQPGETVFIQAGASGLGMAAIQLVKALGNKIVTTVSSDPKAQFVRQLGADVIINRKTQDIATILAEHPVDVAMDCVAGPDLGRCIATMARGGRWIVIATLGGNTSELDMNDYFRRGVRLIGSTLRSRTDAMKSDILAQLHTKLWPAFSDGRIKAIIHQTLPITQAALAHDILQSNTNMGKVVLTVK